MSLWQDPAAVALQEALLGRYSLERELGRGGMGTVLLARDVRLDRAVAIKVLHPELARRPEARERFLREARLAARLAHPHIVPVYAVEEREGIPFLVMAYIDGETLGERLRRRGALPPDDAERVLRETAWALGYAHARGVLHRDLTPDNILLDRATGRAVLADFGLAREADVAERGPVFGTPGYLAPEAIRGDPTDARSDLYALGVIGWTALAGRAPFTADTTAQLLAKHLVQAPPPLAGAARGASRRLIAAVETCLAKDPDARPADAAAWAALLERAPEPVAIAPPLRAWFTRWDRVRSVYALAMPVLAMQTWLMVDGYFRSGADILLTAALLTTLLTLTAIPVGIHVAFEVRELRRLGRHGFGVHDLRAAFAPWREARHQAAQREGLPPLPGRVLADLVVVGAVLILVAFGVLWPLMAEWIPDRAELFWSRLTLLRMLSTVYLATLSGAGLLFLVGGHRLAPGGLVSRLQERFWRSRVAGFLVKLAALGDRASAPASATLHRPTEVVLGLALEDLWRALPADLRDGVDDVPAVAATLQRGAEELRTMLDGLRESERLVGHDEGLAGTLAAAREALELRHRETIAALERLRLQLLRLLATRQRTADLRAQLDAARDLEQGLLRDLAGHAAARRVLHRTSRDPLRTPTPSPA